MLHILCHWLSPLTVLFILKALVRWLKHCSIRNKESTWMLRYLNTDIPPEPVEELRTGSRIEGEGGGVRQSVCQWFLSEYVYGISGCWAVSNLCSVGLWSCQVLLQQAHSLTCKADVGLSMETHRQKLSRYNTTAPYKDRTFTAQANSAQLRYLTLSHCSSLILLPSCAYKYTCHFLCIHDW